MRQWRTETESPVSANSKYQKEIQDTGFRRLEDTFSESTIPIGRENGAVVNKLALENAKILQDIQMKEEKIRSLKSQIDEYVEKMRLKHHEDRNLEILAAEVDSLQQHVESMELEYSQISKAEDDLGKRLDLLKKIESQVVSTRKTVLTCVGLKLLSRKLETLTKSRLGLGFRAARGRIGKGKSIFIAAITMRTTIKSKLHESLRRLRTHGYEEHAKNIDLLDRSEWFVQQNNLKRKFLGAWHHTYLARRSTRCFVRSKLAAVFQKTTARMRNFLSRFLRSAQFGDCTHQGRNGQLLVLNKLNFHRRLQSLRNLSPRPFLTVQTPRTLTLSRCPPSLLLLALTSLSLNSSLKPPEALGKRQALINFVTAVTKYKRAADIIQKIIKRKIKICKEQTLTRILHRTLNRSVSNASFTLDELAGQRQEAEHHVQSETRQSKGILAFQLALEKISQRVLLGFNAIKIQSETKILHIKRNRIVAKGLLEHLIRENRTSCLESGFLNILSVARAKSAAITQQQIKYNQQLDAEVTALRNHEANYLRPTLYRSKTLLLLQLVRKLIAKPLSHGFLRINLTTPVLGFRILHQILTASRIKRFVLNRLKKPKPTWPADSKTVNKLALRLGFQKLRSCWRKRTSKHLSSAQHLISLLSHKFSSHTYHFFQQLDQIRVLSLKKDLEDVKTHLKSMQNRLQSTKTALDDREKQVKQADGRYLLRFLVRKNRIVEKGFFLGALMLSKVFVRPNYNCWRYLGRILHKLGSKGVRPAFQAVVASKFTINVYGLQTARDDACRAYLENKQHWSEQSGLLEQAQSSLQKDREGIEFRLQRFENVMDKLVSALQRKRLLKKGAREWFKFIKKTIKTKKLLLRRCILQRTKKYFLALVSNKEEKGRFWAKLENFFQKRDEATCKIALEAIREAGKERRLRELAKQVLRGKREVERREKEAASVGRDRFYGLSGSFLAQSGSWENPELIPEEIGQERRSKLGSVFRCWKIWAKDRSRKNNRVKLFRKLLAYRTRQSVFAELKCLRKHNSPQLPNIRVLQPADLVVGDLASKYSSQLFRCCMLRLHSSLRGKVRKSFEILDSWRNESVHRILVNFSVGLEAVLLRSIKKNLCVGLGSIRRQVLDSCPYRIVELRLQQQRKNLLRNCLLSLPKVGERDDGYWARVILCRGATRLVTTERQGHEVLRMGSVLRCWRRILIKKRIALNRISDISRALRSWKDRVSELQPPKPAIASTTFEEIEMVRQETREIRQLAYQARIWIRKGVEAEQQTRVKTRLDVSVLVEGTALRIDSVIRKLIRKSKNYGLSRMKFFSSGPMILEGKISLQAMVKQVEQILADKSILEREKARLEHKLKEESLDQVELKNLIGTRLETEENLLKVNRLIEITRHKNAVLREQISKALTEKQKLVQLLKTVVMH